MFVTPPPAQYKQPVARPEAECSTSVAAPVVDGLIAGYQMFRTGYAIQASDSDYRDVPISRGADIAIGIGMTALFVASTVYGGINVSACKRLKNGPAQDDDALSEDSDRSNGWRINQEAPEPWDTSQPAPRPNAVPATAPAPPTAGPPTTVPSDLAPPPVSPAPAAPPPAPGPSTAPAVPPHATFPDPP